MPKTVEIEGNTFVFPEAYCQRHAHHGPKTFWWRPVNKPQAFEKEERLLLKQHIRLKDTVLELGGFVGVTACLINKLIDPDVRHQHVVFEVDPLYAGMLANNGFLNHCDFRVVCGQIVEPTARTLECFHTPKTHDVTTLGVFNTLVMDIEGAEYDFIDQNPAFFPGLHKMFIEWHKTAKASRKSMRKQYRAKLRDMGFVMSGSVGSVDYWERP